MHSLGCWPFLEPVLCWERRVEASALHTKTGSCSDTAAVPLDRIALLLTNILREGGADPFIPRH